MIRRRRTKFAADEHRERIQQRRSGAQAGPKIAYRACYDPVMYYVAQVNIARMRGLLEDEVMSGFVARLQEINALADTSPGFVWRLQSSGGNATYLRPYDDDRILFNLSVWETVEALRHYVYRTAHVELLRQRHEWFHKFESASVALWWVPASHLPGVDEAKKRLAWLDAHGPTQFAFTFKTIFEPDEEFQRAIDWSSFDSCAVSKSCVAIEPAP